MTSVTFQGFTYSDDGSSPRDMRGGGHRQHLLPMLRGAMLDLSQGVADASSAKVDAQTARDQAQAAATDAASDRAAVAADKSAVQTDRTAVAADKTAVTGMRDEVQAAATQIAADKTATAADRAAVADDRATVAADKSAVQVNRDAVAADRTAVTGLRDQAQAAATAAAGSAGAAAADRTAVATDKASTATALAQAQALVGTAGTGTATGLAYAALTKALASAADVVAVHVYDTRLDSDGGAWATRPAGSWYWEPLGTATRGATRRFPAVALIVARAASITIYDAHDLDATGVPRMWMVFSANATATYALYAGGGIAITGIHAYNGRLWVTSNTSGIGGLTEIDFPGDRSHVRRDIDFAFNACRALSQRNTPLSAGGLVPKLLDDACTGVHARVLPGAPLDNAGLPIPTVAVATASGASVIHPWGPVYDISYAGGYRAVQIGADGRLDLSAADAARIDFGGLPYADIAHSAWRAGAMTPSAPPALLAPTGTSRMALSGSRAAGGADGLTLRAPDAGNPANGMVAHVATSFATGWMPGDIRGAWLCDTATGSVTGGTLPDRSIKARSLDVTGTLTRTALPCGLAAVSAAWGAANRLSQAAHADMDWTGDFWARAWVSMPTGNGRVIGRTTDAAGTVTQWRLAVGVDVGCEFVTPGGNLLGMPSVAPSVWTCIDVCRRGATVEMWQQGVLVGSAAATVVDLTSASAVLYIGSPVSGTGASPAGTQIVLARVAAYAPTPAQIRRMYEDERALIIGGMPATLGGTSNSVTALAANDAAGTLVVGTGDGVSVFAGLGRVQYLDGASGGAAIASDAITALSAGGPHLLIGTSAGAGLISDGVIARDRLAPAGPLVPRLAADPQIVQARGVTTDATATDLSPRVYVGEREAVTLDVTVQARTYGASSTQGGHYRRQARYVRDAGGNVTLAGSVQTIGTDQETTAGMDVTLQIDMAAQTVTPRVTGVAGTRIVWTARIVVTRISEDLTYAVQ